MIDVTGQVSPQLHVGTCMWVDWRRGISTMQETIRLLLQNAILGTVRMKREDLTWVSYWTWRMAMSFLFSAFCFHNFDVFFFYENHTLHHACE